MASHLMDFTWNRGTQRISAFVYYTEKNGRSRNNYTLRFLLEIKIDDLAHISG